MLNCDLIIPVRRAQHNLGVEEDRLSDRPGTKLLYVPPPLAFVLAFLAGVALNHARPLALPPPLAGVGAAIGAVGIAAGAGLIVGAIALFIHRRTTIVPSAAPARLVVTGPYRLTRNPMYLGLTSLFLGLALALPSFWSLLFVPAPLLLLQGVIIPFEEARMRATFGADYETYCRRVGRWL